MKGLIIKDILNLKRSLGSIIAILIFYIFLAYNSGDPSMLIGMVVFLLAMMTITSISYDDMAKWDKLALAMPISRKTIVLSKYVLSLLLIATGIFLSTTISYIIILINSDIGLPQLLLTSYIIFFLSTIFISIVLPLIFRFGVEKSRLMMMTVIGIPFGLFYLVTRLGFQLPNEDQFMNIIKLSPIFLILFLFISFNTSFKIYKNKDM